MEWYGKWTAVYKLVISIWPRLIRWSTLLIDFACVKSNIAVKSSWYFHAHRNNRLVENTNSASWIYNRISYTTISIIEFGRLRCIPQLWARNLSMSTCVFQHPQVDSCIALYMKWSIKSTIITMFKFQSTKSQSNNEVQSNNTGNTSKHIVCGLLVLWPSWRRHVERIISTLTWIR